MSALIEAAGLDAGYGSVRIVRQLDLTVAPGEVVALLGPNGAGKTTTLLTLAGELPALAGEVLWNGAVTRAPLHTRAREGLALVTEERSIFARLTTRQNLALARGGNAAVALSAFPELGPLMARRGGLLSGGEQQMLALGRALSRPTKLLLADELSLGLAPRMVTRLLRAVRVAADAGMGALLVEQHVHRVLEIADRVYVLRNGSVEFTGNRQEAQNHLTEIESAYLSGRDTKAKERGMHE